MSVTCAYECVLGLSMDWARPCAIKVQSRPLDLGVTVLLCGTLCVLWHVVCVTRTAIHSHGQIMQAAAAVYGDLSKVANRALSVVVAAGASGEGVSFSEGARLVARQGARTQCNSPWLCVWEGGGRVWTPLLQGSAINVTWPNFVTPNLCV